MLPDFKAPHSKKLGDGAKFETVFEQDLLFWGADYKLLLFGLKNESYSCWAHFTSIIWQKRASVSIIFGQFHMKQRNFAGCGFLFYFSISKLFK